MARQGRSRRSMRSRISVSLQFPTPLRGTHEAMKQGPNFDGIAAYCDHPVRFRVVESLNTTIKGVVRRARGMRDETNAAAETEVGDRETNSISPRSRTVH
jgi:hypothetical protein